MAAHGRRPHEAGRRLRGNSALAAAAPRSGGVSASRFASQLDGLLAAALRAVARDVQALRVPAVILLLLDHSSQHPEEHPLHACHSVGVVTLVLVPERGGLHVQQAVGLGIRLGPFEWHRPPVAKVDLGPDQCDYHARLRIFAQFSQPLVQAQERRLIAHVEDQQGPVRGAVVVCRDGLELLLPRRVPDLQRVVLAGLRVDQVLLEEGDSDSRLRFGQWLVVDEPMDQGGLTHRGVADEDNLHRTGLTPAPSTGAGERELCC
mmetsp:Transcript_132243/g.382337  ORF Transcript_132243/g.382337 Transcript_132243/m.382337 type:complete len:262 (+) Transcript_132243:232-1017(+)